MVSVSTVGFMCGLSVHCRLHVWSLCPLQASCVVSVSTAGFMCGLCVHCRLHVWSLSTVGFMCGTTVLDKDGVSAAMVMAEMTGWLAERSLTLRQKLDDIYDT